MVSREGAKARRIEGDEKRLKFIAPLRNERTDATSDHPDYLGLENIQSWTGRLLTSTTSENSESDDSASGTANVFYSGDVLFGKLRPYLAKALHADKKGVCSTELLVIKPQPDIHPRFLLYSMLSPDFVGQVDASTFGAKMPRANWEFIGSMKLPIPAYDTQRLIADYLDRETARIDALVAEKETMLALLEEKRAALVSRAVTRGLDPNVPLKPSGLDWLGDIPAHWETRRLKYLTHEPLAYGANEAALEDNPDWPRFVRITDINEDGTLRDETFRSLPPEIAEPYLLETGDVLFARSGATVGKTFIYRPEWGEACFAGYLIRFRSAQELVLPDFVYYFSLSDIYWQQVESGTIQATIQNFSAEKYAELIVCLPPPSEQKAIVDFLIDAEQRTSTLLAEIRSSIERLKERRAALITAAVTGQIDTEQMRKMAGGCHEN
jgi:type I restriction enzyme S subunit